MTRIYSVDCIDLALIKKNPPDLLVMASGRVTTNGWTNPRLEPFVYIVPPADGVLDCDMAATPPAPGDIVLQVITPVFADLVLTDVENYWEPGMPLKGVRIHSTNNSKTALLEEVPEGMPPVRVMAETDGAMPAAPSFETDIKPLFRTRDVRVMKRISDFDLHVYEDVSAAADRILARLEDKTMPCDGAWPDTDIQLFATWIEAGKLA